MDRDARSAKAFRAWRSTMFWEFFAKEQPCIANAILAVHHTSVRHLEQYVWSNVEYAAMEGSLREGIAVGTAVVEIARQLWQN